MISKKNNTTKKIGSLPVGSLITGADFHQDSNTLMLTGYGKNKRQYLYVISDFSLATVPTLAFKQYELDYRGAQIEAISVIDEKTAWITSETTRKYLAFLAKIELP